MAGIQVITYNRSLQFNYGATISQYTGNSHSLSHIHYQYTSFPSNISRSGPRIYHEVPGMALSETPPHLGDQSESSTVARYVCGCPHGNLTDICHSVQVRSDPKAKYNSQRYHDLLNRAFATLPPPPPQHEHALNKEQMH